MLFVQLQLLVCATAHLGMSARLCATMTATRCKSIQTNRTCFTQRFWEAGHISLVFFVIFEKNEFKMNYYFKSDQT